MIYILIFILFTDYGDDFEEDDSKGKPITRVFISFVDVSITWPHFPPALTTSCKRPCVCIYRDTINPHKVTDPNLTQETADLTDQLTPDLSSDYHTITRQTDKTSEHTNWLIIHSLHKCAAAF